jgi:hypothetical protein
MFVILNNFNEDVTNYKEQSSFWVADRLVTDNERHSLVWNRKEFNKSSTLDLWMYHLPT